MKNHGPGDVRPEGAAEWGRTRSKVNDKWGGLRRDGEIFSVRVARNQKGAGRIKR